MSLYIQINLLLTVGWLLFSLAGRSLHPFQIRKSSAQAVLLACLVIPALVHCLPASTWAQLRFNNIDQAIQDTDGGGPENRPMQRALNKVTNALAPQPQTESNGPSLWIILLVSGITVMLLRSIWNTIEIYRILLNSWCLHRIRRVQVLLSDSIGVPFSFRSLLTAYVVLPTSLVPHVQDFRIALRHEIEHQRNGDTLWTLIMEALVCLCFWNPAIYAWRRSILELQELACDEALISRIGISAHAYGCCLLRVAEMALTSRVLHAGTTCMIPTARNQRGHSFLTRRIKMFAQHEHKRDYGVFSFVIGTILALLMVGSAFAMQSLAKSGHGPNADQPVFDKEAQALATGSLRKWIPMLQADGGFILISEATTGRLLASVGIRPEQSIGNWELSYATEPASTIKPIITAAAIENKLITPDSVFDGDNGALKYGQLVYHDSENHGPMSTTDVVVQSSNIGMIKIADLMGATALSAALEKFGFGEGGSTSGFPAANSGFVPASSNANLVPSLALGSSHRTGFYVTPLEMVQAYGAIANGGRLMKPIIASSSDSQVLRQVLSPQTAAQVRTILRKVVSEGTAQSIDSSFVPLAGKTGTSEGSNGKGMGSFIGYAPADNPKYVIYVGILNPKVKNASGSRTAAPVFKDIAEKLVGRL